jgi:MerR family transcriptional regulator, light-induced transcriptional regulator
MNTLNPMAAELLETSANGYAAAACAAFERHRAGTDADGSHAALPAEWRGYFVQRLLELAAAVRVEEPALFARRIDWLRRAMTSRGADAAELRAALLSLRDALREELPATLLPVAAGPIDAALAQFEREAQGEAGILDHRTPAGRLALQFLEACLSAEPERGSALVLDALDQFGAEQIYVDVLVPAEKEIGRLWHTGDVTVAEERIVTETTRSLIAVIAHHCAPPQRLDRTVLAASVAGNTHDIGLRVAAELFRLVGYRSLFLGANVPTDQLARAVQMFSADLVLLNATLETHLHDATRAIEMLRQSSPAVKVLVGGHVFDSAPEVWRRVGADAYAASLREAVATGVALLGSAANGH